MKTLKKYLITIGVEVLAVLTIILFKDIFHAIDVKTVIHILCDAFFVVGVTVTGVGLLIFSTNEGAFDGLSFSVQSFLTIFKKNMEKKYKDFFDYKERHSDKKYDFGYLLICGAIFLAIGVILNIIHGFLL